MRVLIFIILKGVIAPVYSTESLHSAVVELIAKRRRNWIRYTTIQNWSKDVYNLVTKRAYAYENASVESIDGNLGSKLTMKYPGVYMLGKNAHAEIVSVAFAERISTKMLVQKWSILHPILHLELRVNL